MAKFCLTKELADNLKKAAVAGDIDIAKMYGMSSSERSNLFEKYVDKTTAKNINAGFEEAMISDQQTALTKWVNDTFTGSEKVKTRKKDLIDKIDRLKELGVLTPKAEDAFLSDLVATRLGITVTAEEAGTIAQKADKLQELGKEKSEFGTPTLEYFKAKNDLEKYLESLSPSSRVKVTTSISGRGAMLFSLKSPLLNIESNTVQGLLSAAERRIASKSLTGKNSDYAKNYIKFVNKVHSETGYDISRMRTLDGPQKVRGEEMVTAQGKGTARKIARFYEDIVFKKLMSAPDVAFSSINFSDSANLASTKLAKGDKAKALEIFKDATRIDPQTKEGKKVREQAIADAEYATYTNDSKYSEVALGIRKILNIASGDLRLGDQLMPFVKTPANVVGAGIDASGVLLPVDTLIRVGKTMKAIKNGETLKSAAKTNFDGYARKLIRAGLGTTIAFAIANLFDPEDFIGEYPVSEKERELLRLKNATTNSVRIGDNWVSLDYFGALGAPLIGMLYAKKYGENTGDALFNYYAGVGKQLVKIPGLEIGKDVFETLDRSKFNDTKEVAGEVQKGVVDYMRSRTIPAFVYDLAKATDKYERQTNKDKPLTSVQGAIPGLRQQLPIKKTVLGDDVTTENPISTILFGARVKDVKSTPVIDELSRLSETGNLPSITDYAKTSERFKGLKAQVGEERFTEAQAYLGETLNDRIDKRIKSGSYKNLSDEKKAKELNDIKTEVLEQTLRKFGYKRGIK